MKTNSKIYMKIISLIFLILITSCNNIFLDDLIDNNLNTPSIPVSDGITTDGTFLDWKYIPVSLSKYQSSQVIDVYDIQEFKIAINSSRTMLYFYFSTNGINQGLTSYVVILSNDLACNGKRILLSTINATPPSYTELLDLCYNSAPLSSVSSTYYSTAEIEGSIDLSVYGSTLNLNDKIFISVYSVRGVSIDSPFYDSLPGKWVWFNKPQ